jgi:hypothetical protein
MAAQEINSVDGWLYAFKIKRQGIILGDNGTFQIRDTKNPSNPPRIIPHKFGIDAYTVENTEQHPELRAQATAKLHEINVATTNKVDIIYENVKIKETAYQKAIDSWEQEHTADNAIQVARTQRELSAIMDIYKNAQYKHRNIHDVEAIQRILLDYRTKDTRTFPHVLHIGTYDTTKSAERAISIVTDTV